MKKLYDVVRGTSSAFGAVAGVALAFLMFLTVADVVLRLAGHPIVGTYELVAISGAVAIGLSLPITSWMRGHIYVDTFVARLPRAPRAVLIIATRLMVIALFVFIGWNLIEYAMDLRKAGEVSPTLRVPFYPVAIAVGVSCLFQCVVIAADILKVLRGEYE